MLSVKINRYTEIDMKGYLPELSDFPWKSDHFVVARQMHNSELSLK